MKQQTITLKCYRDGEPVLVEVQGFQKGGLAVHKDLRKSTHYTLTHLATSVIVCSHRMNRAQAVQWLEEAAELLDWTQNSLFVDKRCVEVPRIATRITGREF